MRQTNSYRHMRVRDDGQTNSGNWQFPSCTTTCIWRTGVFLTTEESVNNFVFWKYALIPLLIYPLFSLDKPVAYAPINQTTKGTSVAAQENRKCLIFILCCTQNKCLFFVVQLLKNQCRLAFHSICIFIIRPIYCIRINF